MTKALRIALVGLLLIAACDRSPDSDELTAPDDALTVDPAAMDKVGADVLETLRRGEPASVVVALNLEAPREIRSSEDLGEVRRLVRTAQDESLGPISRNELDVRRQYRTVPAFSAVVRSEAAVRQLADNPRVRRVDLDLAGTGTLGTSVPFIRADLRHDRGNDGAGVTVAILDTGIDTDHPDFSGALVAEACFGDNDGTIDGNGFCPGGGDRETGAGSGEDDAGHGTHVAGIVASRGTVSGAGMAPGASLVSIKVTDNCSFSGCFSYFSEIVAALDYIIDNNDDLGVDIINMSLGTNALYSGDCDAASAGAMAGADAINTLRGMGVTTFASSGNNSSGTEMPLPACIANVISVGSADESDNVAGSSNSNAQTDIFAPGVNITSLAIGGGTTNASGTSMASPHAAGCAALLMESGDATTPNNIETRLESSPFSVTDPTNELSFPRIDCVPDDNAAPEVNAVTDPVTVDEGQTAENSGTFSDPDGDAVSLSASVGSISEDAPGSWSWSYDTSDGPAESQTVTITGTDALGQSTDVTFELVVQNVAPTVTIDAEQATSIDESPNAVGILAHFTDPGTDDAPFSAEVLCWDAGAFGSSTVPGTVNVTGTDPEAAGDVSADCVFGDNGTFEVTVTVTDKDGGSGSASFDMEVGNVAPTVAIDETGAVVINGTPTFLAQIGDPLSFDGHAEDPGSDDLFFAWDWDDGSSSSSTDYLLDAPNADPTPSPSADARDVWDTQSHSWTGACSYAVELAVTDDDGGSGSDQVDVIITGDAGYARSQGYWQTEYRGKKSQIEDATLDCYLEIIGQLSQVFDEEVDASTQNKAAQVLKPNGNLSTTEQLDIQLLAAWLNFANGAFEWDDLVDTDGDMVPDTPFSTVIMTAESVRLDPAATEYELEMQKSILEYVNVIDE